MRLLDTIHVITIACALLAATARAEPSPDEWRAQVNAARGDDSLARFYTFDEGEGPVTANRAGVGEGALLMVGYSPYGVYRGDSSSAAPDPSDCPRWTTGRWPWKRAVECGRARWQLCRSLYYGKPAPFTVVAWLRAHEPKEYEYPGGDVLACGSGWGEGWRLFVEKRNWCPDGNACFIIGTPKGTQSVRIGHFPFGSWHLLAAVWDGTEIRLQVDGQSASSPFAGPFTPCPAVKQGEDKVAGLVVGGFTTSRPGALRFDIDELRIHERALSAEELHTLYERFRPQTTDKEQRDAFRKAMALRTKQDEIVFQFPIETGGYFVKGTPIETGVRAPDGLTSTSPLSLRMRVTPKDNEQAVFDETLPLAPSTQGTTAAQLSFTPTSCGLFTVSLSLLDDTKHSVAGKQYPIAVVSTPSENSAPRLVIGTRQTASPQHGARTVGVQWSRIVVEWSRIEPKKNEYRWDDTDRLFDAAAASGLKVLCCPSAFPSWLPLADTKKAPADLESYKRFLQLLGSRYRGVIAAWEIWDAPSGPPAFFFRDGAGPAAYRSIVEAAAAELAHPLFADRLAAGTKGLRGLSFQHSPGAEHPGGIATSALFAQPPRGDTTTRWNTACGCLQAADRMGTFIPDAFDSPVYHERTFSSHGFQGVKAWPYVVLSQQDSAAWTVRELLAEHAAGVNGIFLPSALDEYYPVPNASDGSPSEKGVAIAALLSLLATATSVTELQLEASAPFKAFKVERTGAQAVLAVFAKDNLTVKGSLQGKEPVEGVDWRGNPIAPLAPDASGSIPFSVDAHPLYLFTSASPQFEQPRNTP